MSNKLYALEYDLATRAIKAKEDSRQGLLKVGQLGVSMANTVSQANERKLKTDVSEIMSTSKTPEDAEVRVNKLREDYANQTIAGKTFGASGVWNDARVNIESAKVKRDLQVQSVYSNQLLTQVKNLPSLTNDKEAFGKSVDELVSNYSSVHGEIDPFLNAQIDSAKDDALRTIERNRLEDPVSVNVRNMDSRWNDILTQVVEGEFENPTESIRNAMAREDSMSSEIVPEYQRLKEANLARVLSNTDLETLKEFQGDLSSDKYEATLKSILAKEKQADSLRRQAVKKQENMMYDEFLENGRHVTDYKFENEEYERMNNYIRESGEIPPYAMSYAELLGLPVKNNEEIGFRKTLADAYKKLSTTDFPAFTASKTPELSIPQLIIPKTDDNGTVRYLEESFSSLQELAESFYQVRGLYGEDYNIQMPFSKDQAEALGQAILDMPDHVALSYMADLNHLFSRDGDGADIMKTAFGDTLGGGINNWGVSREFTPNSVRAWGGYKQFMNSSNEIQSLYNERYKELMSDKFAKMTPPASSGVMQFVKNYTIGLAVSSGGGIQGVDQAFSDTFNVMGSGGQSLILFKGQENPPASIQGKRVMYDQIDMSRARPMVIDPNSGLTLGIPSRDGYVIYDLERRSSLPRMQLAENIFEPLDLIGGVGVRPY